jgi:hypothetical protein
LKVSGVMRKKVSKRLRLHCSETVLKLDLELL